MDESTTFDDLLLKLTSLADSDRAVNLDAAAILLGMKPGTFRQIAAQPGFPKPAKMGKRNTWRRRELLGWWDKERARQNPGS